MDTVNVRRRVSARERAAQGFQEVLTQAQGNLDAKLEGRYVHGGVEATVRQLFEAGEALGLTHKEIAKVLLKPFAVNLRPGLNKPS